MLAGGGLLGGILAGATDLLGGGTAAGSTGIAPCGSGEDAGALSISGQQYTCTYTRPGEEVFNLPPGASTTISVTAVGAPGGDGGNYGSIKGPIGAPGAIVQAPSLTVPSGLETLYVEVGGAGGSAASGLSCSPGSGGQNGGARGGDSRCEDGPGGGGGGASDLRVTPASAGGLTAAEGDPRLVVAGGGGGAGGTIVSPGGASGSAGDSEVSGAGDGGQADCEGFPAQAGGPGGIGAGGGLGGQEIEPIFCSEPAGANGSAGLGGEGGNGNLANAAGGGGGGGGYVGGGGGAYGDGGGGGGGGSSFGPAGSAYETATLGQAAEVIVTYTMPPTITTTTTSVTTTTTVSSNVTQTLTETLTKTVSTQPPAARKPAASTRSAHASADGYSFTLAIPRGCLSSGTTLDVDLYRNGLPGDFTIRGYSYLVGHKRTLRDSPRLAGQARGRLTSYLSLDGLSPGTHELTVRVLLAKARDSTHAISPSAPTLKLPFTVCGRRHAA